MFSQNSFLGHIFMAGSTHRRFRKRINRFEPLERRHLLAGDVVGLVFDDVNENSIRDAGEDLVAGKTAYIDLNRNGRLDGGEPASETTSIVNADGGNYRITNSLAANQSYAVRLDVDISQVVSPGLTSSWTDTQSELSDAVGDTKARDVVSGDFDGDGNTDIAVLQQLRSINDLASVAIFLAEDDGSFLEQASKTIEIGNATDTPTEFVSADLNANGKSDLIIVDSGVGEITLLGDFTGQDFSMRDKISVSGPVDVIVDNFDSDPELEIVVLSKGSASQVTVYQPDSPFDYSGGSPVLTGRNNPGRFVVADFNNDQNLDLAVFHAAATGSPGDTEEIWVLLGEGDGTFATPIFGTFAGRTFVSSIVAGQFAGDENADLAVVSGSFVAILAGDGTGKFSDVDQIDDSEDQGEPSRLSTADLDGDGDSDLALTSIRNNGDRFTDALVYENVSGSFVRRYRAFQVNVVFTSKRVAPILLDRFHIRQGDVDVSRLVIVAPSQSIEDEQLGLKQSSAISKEYTVFLRSTTFTGRDFAVHAVAPSLSIEAAQADRDEGDTGSTAFTFHVTRQGDVSGESSVTFSVSGSGNNPADEADFGGAFPSGMVDFAASESGQTITIDVSGDTHIESDEGFRVTLSAASGNATIETATADGSINNDDVITSSFSIASDVHEIEGDDGSTEFVWNVSREGDLSQQASVEFSAVGSGFSPATADDFGGTLPGGRLEFAASEPAKTITVVVSADSQVELDEEFTVTLHNATGSARIAAGQAHGLIFDDDGTSDNRLSGSRVSPPPEFASGDPQATAILFRAEVDTTFLVGRLGPVTLQDPSIRLLDEDLREIAFGLQAGIDVAELESGHDYALIFEGDDFDTRFLLRSSAGIGSLSENVPANFLLPADVNADGDVSALDALLIINEIARQEFVDAELTTSELVSGRYYDVNDNGEVSANDALRVINEMARRQTRGESESQPLGTRTAREHSSDITLRLAVDGRLDLVVAKVVSSTVPLVDIGHRKAVLDNAATTKRPGPATAVDELLSDDQLFQQLLTGI